MAGNASSALPSCAARRDAIAFALFYLSDILHVTCGTVYFTHAVYTRSLARYQTLAFAPLSDAILP